VTVVDENFDAVIEGLDENLFRSPEEQFFAPDFVRDPFASFRQMRDRYGVVFDRATAVADGFLVPNPFLLDESQPIFVVLGYDAALEALQHGEIFTNQGYANSVALVFGHSLTTQDGEEHQRYRKLLQQSFRRQVVERWATELIEPTADYLITRLAAKGHGDLVRELAAPLPFRVTARMLGIGSEHFGRFFGLACDLLHIGYDPAAAFAAKDELIIFLRGQIEDRRRNPTDDMISTMVHAEVDGHRLPEDVIIPNLVQILPAGIETTFRSSSNMFVHLLQNRDQFESVVADPNLVQAAVEEGLRLEGPAFQVPRVLASDYTLGGVSMPAGAAVMVSQAMASRDAGRWQDPDRFDVHRAIRPHLAFVAGPHTCLGLHLARMQMQTTLRLLAERLPDTRLTEADVSSVGFMLRSPARCPVEFGTNK
jgi:cytochrome P450